MCIIQLQYSYNPSFLSLPSWKKGLTHQGLQDRGLLNRHLWNPDQMRLIIPSPKKFVYVGDRYGLELAKNSHMISRLIFSEDCIKIPQHLLLISLTKFEKKYHGWTGPRRSHFWSCSFLGICRSFWCHLKQSPIE